jgi:endonuclease/exonuclease/phosphatase family metal-dependent hydrolase
MAAVAHDTLTIRVMTYNLRFGERASLEELGEHIKSFQPDFVALQEVDWCTHRAGVTKQHDKDFMTVLAQQTKMHPLYGKTIEFAGGYYGIGILSNRPCIRSSKKMLCQPLGKEQRVLLQADYEVTPHDTMTFACTHLDYFSSATRLKQAAQVVDYLKETPYPTLVAGDFNAIPTSLPITKGMDKWYMLCNLAPTYPAWNPTEQIDYIFGNPTSQWQLVRSQAVLSLLSDHLPVVSDILLIRKK